MLLDLEPLATQSVKDVIESVYVDEITKKVKQNFDDLIDWFENTYGSVHLYKSGMDMNKRVDSIRKKIYKRAEKVQIQETDEDD
jgi:predicted SpoU family rRNA methylase